MDTNVGTVDSGFAANKVFTMAGVAYKPGDPVDVSNLPGHKIKQFLNQRILVPVRTGPGQTTR